MPQWNLPPAVALVAPAVALVAPVVAMAQSPAQAAADLVPDAGPMYWLAQVAAAPMQDPTPTHSLAQSMVLQRTHPASAAEALAHIQQQ